MLVVATGRGSTSDRSNRMPQHRSPTGEITRFNPCQRLATRLIVSEMFEPPCPSPRLLPLGSGGPDPEGKETGGQLMALSRHSERSGRSDDSPFLLVALSGRTSRCYRRLNRHWKPTWQTTSMGFVPSSPLWPVRDGRLGCSGCPAMRFARGHCSRSVQGIRNGYPRLRCRDALRPRIEKRWQSDFRPAPFDAGLIADPQSLYCELIEAWGVEL